MNTRYKSSPEESNELLSFKPLSGSAHKNVQVIDGLTERLQNSVRPNGLLSHSRSEQVPFTMLTKTEVRIFRIIRTVSENTQC